MTRRLFTLARHRICRRMRATLLLIPAVLGVSLVIPALAETGHPVPAKPVAAKPAVNGPTPIGTWEKWTAATYQDAGKTVCYALTRAAASSPALPGRGQPVLTVTIRPPGREYVAISAGYTYPPKATVAVRVEKTSLDFYTSQRSAFAHDGHAAVLAFGKGMQAVAKGPGPRGAPVTDMFSLAGFDSAYAAILKACPAK